MKLLLVGNHTSGNRGDCAILRGLVSEIESLHPDAVVEITSRYPTSSTYLLGRQIGPDAFHEWRRQQGAGLARKLLAAAHKQMFSLQLYLAARLRWHWLVWLLPRAARDEIERIRRFDAVVHVGGSFFVDAYGAGQYDYSLATMAAGQPLILAGHSMGPFAGWFQRRLARLLLDRAAIVALREPASRRVIEQCGLPLVALSGGADTAWLVRPEVATIAQEATARRYIEPGRSTIAISLRELAPFDKRLGILQSDYEQAFARLVAKLIDADHDVIALSTCTGIEGYRHDDRINALRVAAQIGNERHFRVIMDELTDTELGTLFAQCRLVVSTRLHAAIIALNVGTPAFAIRYEHKSEGLMSQLGLPELSVTMQDFMDPAFVRRVMDVACDTGSLTRRIATQVSAERALAAAMVARCLRAVPLPSSCNDSSDPA